MKKELIIAARFDTQDFDRSVEQMQRKLKEIYAPADMVRAQSMTSQRLQGMGLGGNLSQPSQEQYQRATQQSRRELDALIREQALGQEKLGKMIALRAEKLKELQEQQKKLVKGSQEELEIKEKIARVEENSFRQKEAYKQRDAQLNQLLDARNKVAPRDIPGLIDSFRHGGFRHGMSQIPGAFRQNPFGMGGAALSAVGGLMTAGSDLYRDFSAGPIRTEAAMGNAVQGTMGRDVANIYNRRTAFEMMFGGERARAAQMALQNLQATKNADLLGLGGNLALVGGGAALAAKGAGVGAGLGSVIPGLGTAAGSAVGALPGLLAGGKGLMNLFGDERQRSLMLSPLSQTASRRYQSMLAEQVASDYEATLEAQKKQNPFKTMAVQEYEQNFMRNLQSQRSLGLQNNDFYGQGGFLRSAIGQGFTPEMAMEMASGVLGAGGSTRMARDSVFGLQMQKGFDMTNASQVLGTLSGGMGSSEATKQATVRILSEGMRLGLDDSKFAEENRRFTQAAAEIITRSGARGDADFDRISGGFGRFMSENSNKGIEAAKSAYEQYQQISSTTTGPRGVMRAAGFLKDEKLSQLSTIEKQALMQIPEEQLNENNLLVKGAADKLGISSQELVSRIQGVNQGAVSRFSEADQIRDRLRGRLKELGVSQLTSENINQLPADVKQDAYQLMAYQTTELGYKGQREQDALLSGIIGKTGEPMGPGSGAEAVKARLAGTETGRMEDNTVAAMAADAGTVLKNFNEMRGEMDAAAKSAAAFTDHIRELNAQLMQALEETRSGKSSKDLSSVTTVLQSIQNMMNSGGSQVQPQGGKTSK